MFILDYVGGVKHIKALATRIRTNGKLLIEKMALLERTSPFLLRYPWF
jgi:hypothetical protein